MWAFAKAPLIIGTDLAAISQESLAILKNEALIGLNQDMLGNQANCMKGCDLGGSTSVYQAIVDQKYKLFMAVLIVNWDDATPTTVSYDFIEMGVASSATDNCQVTNLWTGETRKMRGGVQYTTDSIAPHGSAVLKVKCLPF